MHTNKRCSRAIVILAVLILAVARVAWAELFNDIWQFNKGSVEFNALNPTNPPPVPRHSHAATSIEDKMFVLFGIRDTGTASGVVIFRFTSWRPVRPPCA